MFSCAACPLCLACISSISLLRCCLFAHVGQVSTGSLRLCSSAAHLAGFLTATSALSPVLLLFGIIFSICRWCSASSPPSLASPRSLSYPLIISSVALPPLFVSLAPFTSVRHSSTLLPRRDALSLVCRVAPLRSFINSQLQDHLCGALRCAYAPFCSCPMCDFLYCPFLCTELSARAHMHAFLLL